MDVDVRAHVGEDLDGVETVVAEVVVSQGQINFAGDDGAAFLGVKADVKVGVFQNVHRLVGLDLVKVDVTHTDANATLVFSALGAVVRGRVVVQRLAAVGLVGAPRGVGVGQTNGVRCRHAGQRQVAGVHVAQKKRGEELLRQGNGAGDVKRYALDTDPEGYVRRRLREAGVDHDGVRLRVGKRDVKRQTLHERDLEVLEFVPKRVVDVQGAHGPLEGRTDPKFGRNARCPRNRVVRGLDAKAFPQSGQPLEREGNGEVVRSVPVHVDVVLKQDQVGSNEQFTGERALVPRLVGGAVVSRGEIDVHGVGVDADAENVVKPQVLHREQRLPEVVRPSIGVRGDVGEELIGPGVVLFKRRSVPQFNLVEHVF